MSNYKHQHPNIGAGLYDNNLDVSYDCTGKCRFIEYAAAPHDPEDECVWMSEIGMRCRSPWAMVAALHALSDAITAENNRMQGK